MNYRGTSYAPGRRPGSGSSNPGNAIQQQYALSGRATLADIPYLYGAAGGVAGGGQEKGGDPMSGFGGEPALGADMGAGPGSAGGNPSGAPSGLPGSLPMTPGDIAGPQTRTVYARPPRGDIGGGGNSDVAGQRAVDSLGFGAADLTLGNVAQGLGFAANIMGPTGAITTGLQAMGHLAAPDLIDSPMPNMTGAFNPRDFLSESEIAQLAAATTPAEAARIKAGLMAKAQQRFDAERQMGLDREWSAPPTAGTPGDFAPPGSIMGQDVARNRDTLTRGTLADVGRRAAVLDAARARGRSGGDNAGGGGSRGGPGGGVGSSRADRAADAPGGARGGVRA